MRFQHRLRINIRACISNNKLLNINVLFNGLDTERYTNFLNEMLEDIPFNTRQMCYQHDGVPGHCEKPATEWLDIHYPSK